MGEFALECFRCTQRGIEVTFLPSKDGLLHVELRKDGKVLTEYIKDPAFTSMCIVTFRNNLLESL